MNFIIPKNYRFKNKIFGIIDYPTAILNILWNVILYLIFKNIHLQITIKIFIFSTLSFPILLFTIVGFNNESPIYTTKYIIKYMLSQKVFLYEKNDLDSYKKSINI